MQESFLIGPLGTNFSEILIKIHIFSFKNAFEKHRLRNGGHFVWTSICVKRYVLTGYYMLSFRVNWTAIIDIVTWYQSSIHLQLNDELQYKFCLAWWKGYGYLWGNLLCLGCVLPCYNDGRDDLTWWRQQMETFSALLAICVGNSPVTGEFPAQRPVTRSSDVFLDPRLYKRLSKQSWG